MDSMIIVSDVVTEDGMRQLHVMSNEPIHMSLPGEATVRQTQEAGAYHLRAEWPFFGMLDIWPREWPKPRRFYVLRLLDSQRVSDAIRTAAEVFEQAAGRAPKFAFVRTLPPRAEDGQDVYGCILLVATWLPRDCVAVGGRR
ncbi:MAG: hypothetical protein ACOYZ6_08005 [Chloroflexota bacterium]